MNLPNLWLFIYRFSTGSGDIKYLAAATDLTRAERNTLTVSFEDIERYNQQLAVTILEEYYRLVIFLELKKFFHVPAPSVTAFVAINIYNKQNRTCSCFLQLLSDAATFADKLI